MDNVFTPKIENDQDSIHAALVQLREDFDCHNHDGSNSISFNVLHVNSLIAGNSILAAQSIAVKKKAYTDDTAGIWLGLVSGVAKAYFGTAAQYFKWTGSGIEMVGSFQTAASGQRITITNSDNFLRFYDASAQVIALGASTDGTNRYFDISQGTGSDLEMVRFIANKTDGTSIILHPVSKGSQTGIRQRNEGTGADRNSSEIAQFEAFNLGTGVGFKAGGSSSYDHLPCHFSCNYASSANPVMKLTQDAITSTHFRKIWTESNSGITIWMSDNTDPNGNLSGTAGDICYNGASHKPAYCTGTTNWTNLV